MAMNWQAFPKNKLQLLAAFGWPYAVLILFPRSGQSLHSVFLTAAAAAMESLPAASITSVDEWCKQSMHSSPRF